MAEFIDFLVVVLPTVIALLGVYVSIKLTKGEPHKIWWGAIIAVGVGTSWLTWISQANARKDHARELGELHTKLDKSLQDEQYMKGQLDTIGLTLGKFSDSPSNSPEVKQFAKSIKEMVDTSQSNSLRAALQQQGRQLALAREVLRNCDAAFLARNPNPIESVSILMGSGFVQQGDSACLLLPNSEYGVFKWKIIDDGGGRSHLESNFEKRGVWGK